MYLVDMDLLNQFHTTVKPIMKVYYTGRLRQGEKCFEKSKHFFNSGFATQLNKPPPLLFPLLMFVDVCILRCHQKPKAAA
jgi:hypothetical protein